MFALIRAWTVRLLSDVGCARPWLNTSLPRPLFKNEKGAFSWPPSIKDMAGRKKNCKWHFADQPKGQEVDYRAELHERLLCFFF